MEYTIARIEDIHRTFRRGIQTSLMGYRRSSNDKKDRGDSDVRAPSSPTFGGCCGYVKKYPISDPLAVRNGGVTT